MMARINGGIPDMLTANEFKAIAVLKTKIAQRFSLDSMTLFGSKARGDDDVWSDIDLLVILRQKVDVLVEEQVYDMAYDVELEYDVVFGVIVFEREYWDGAGRHLPLRDSIEREGKAA